MRWQVLNSNEYLHIFLLLLLLLPVLFSQYKPPKFPFPDKDTLQLFLSYKLSHHYMSLILPLHTSLFLESILVLSDLTHLSRHACYHVQDPAPRQSHPLFLRFLFPLLLPSLLKRQLTLMQYYPVPQFLHFRQSLLSMSPLHLPDPTAAVLQSHRMLCSLQILLLHLSQLIKNIVLADFPQI